jgi:hypothetical protein
MEFWKKFENRERAQFGPILERCKNMKVAKMRWSFVKIQKSENSAIWCDFGKNVEI